MAGEGRKAVIAACIANFCIGIAKLAAFLFTGASSMLAEAVHSAADTGNQALLLYGGARGKRSATDIHPFGYGRERYFWAFIVALVLFLVGSAFALYEGIEKLAHPTEIADPAVALVVLLVSCALESWSFRTALKEAKQLRGNQSWKSFLRHTKSAELPVVLLEDLGALVGLMLALFGVTLTALTGDPRYDAAATIAIGVLLGVIAVFLAFEMHSLLIGEAASPAVQDDIHQAILSQPSVQRLVHMRTLHLGPEELLIAAKVEFDWELSFADVSREIDGVEAKIRERMPSAKLIYIEPAVFDKGRSESSAVGAPPSVPATTRR